MADEDFTPEELELLDEMIADLKAINQRMTDMFARDKSISNMASAGEKNSGAEFIWEQKDDQIEDLDLVHSKREVQVVETLNNGGLVANMGEQLLQPLVPKHHPTDLEVPLEQNYALMKVEFEQLVFLHIPTFHRQLILNPMPSDFSNFVPQCPHWIMMMGREFIEQLLIQTAEYQFLFLAPISTRLPPKPPDISYITMGFAHSDPEDFINFFGVYDGRAIHAQIMKHCEEADQVVNNELFKIYVEYGCFDEVLKVFEVMPQRNMVSHNDAFIEQQNCREIQIMHHLSKHPNVVRIHGTYEDSMAIHLVMEVCEGGALFDRIVQNGHFSEREAAKLIKTIVEVVEACHSLGVMHRDLKPEHFLFDSIQEEAKHKATDFGLSNFYKLAESFWDVNYCTEGFAEPNHSSFKENRSFVLHYRPLFHSLFSHSNVSTAEKSCYLIFWEVGKPKTRWSLLKKRLIEACLTCSSASGIYACTDVIYSKLPNIFLLKFCCHDHRGLLYDVTEDLYELALTLKKVKVSTTPDGKVVDPNVIKQHSMSDVCPVASVKIIEDIMVYLYASQRHHDCWFANQIITVDETKRCYSLFGRGANVVLIFYGRTVNYFSNLRQNLGPGVDGWAISPKEMMSIVVLLEVANCFMSWWVNNFVPLPTRTKKKEKSKMGTMESLQFLVSSRYIQEFATLVVTYGLSIPLVEVTWKLKLKAQFPSPNEYSSFMGGFSTANGIVTFTRIFLSRFSFNKYGWGAAAKKRSPCIIFIDEYEAVGGSRNQLGLRFQKMTLNQLLAELDVFKLNEGIIVIAATDLPELLDTALVSAAKVNNVAFKSFNGHNLEDKVIFKGDGIVMNGNATHVMPNEITKRVKDRWQMIEEKHVGEKA